MIYRKNCCYSLKKTEFKTVWPLIREHQIIECHILCLREAIIEKDFEVVGNFIKFCKTYFPNLFTLEWSNDHVEVATNMARVAIDGGLYRSDLCRPNGGDEFL